MKLHTTLLTLSAIALLTACSQDAKQQNETAVAKADVKTEAKPAAAEPATKTPEANADDEGCIHGDHKPAEGGEGHSCGHGDGPTATGEGHFGQAFTLASAVPLAKSLESKPTDVVQVSGKIDKVCQKMGCWMVVKDGEAEARILMKDHAFTVPLDSAGKDAVIEGTLASQTFSEKQVKHLEKDGGGNPEKVAGERTEYVLTASAVKIAAAQS